MRFVVVDEAAHIFSQCSSSRLPAQFDTLKSLTNTSRAEFVLLGSYDLYDLLFLSGQLARRTQVVHFSRYREDSAQDQRAFMACLQQFQKAREALWGDAPMRHAQVLMENSVGCVGTLKKVLQRAARIAQGRGGWTEDCLREALLTGAQRTQILKEVYDGESRIQSGATRSFEPARAGRAAMREAA